MSSPRAARSRRSRPTRRKSPPPPVSSEPSDASTTRLSVYLRALARCDARGQNVCSSQDLARAAGVKPSLVRKDLTQFGQFGVRGVGYEVRSLRSELTRILGLDRERSVVILGAGNLGMALADSRGFNTGGFRTLALFDNDPLKAGSTSRREIPVLPMEDLGGFVRGEKVDLAILAVPAEAAQQVLDQAAASGVRAVLNFAPAMLKVPPQVHFRTVDLKIHLEGLSYRLSREPGVGERNLPVPGAEPGKKGGIH